VTAAPGAGPGRERGQASVELALVLPAIAILLLAALQVVVVMRDAVALTAASRAAARRAVVEPVAPEVRAAAVAETRLAASRLSVVVGGDRRPGGLATVVVTYRSPTAVPLVGAFVGDIELRERITVRCE